jgi:hypothetical protein
MRRCTRTCGFEHAATNRLFPSVFSHSSKESKLNPYKFSKRKATVSLRSIVFASASRAPGPRFTGEDLVGENVDEFGPFRKNPLSSGRPDSKPNSATVSSFP